jgi:hypothetical protein
MKTNKIRLSLTGLLATVACAGLWFSSSNIAFAGTAKVIHCLGSGATGGTGCYAEYCNFISPNKGITWNATWECCYDPSNNLVSAKNYACSATFNGGCCNNLDAAPHCPDMSCQQSY